MKYAQGFKRTIIGRGDSYKYSHWKQYPKGIDNNNSYIESRGIATDQYMVPQGAEVVFFGLQAFIREYLSTRITKDHVDKAERMTIAHGEPFNREGWMGIVNKHKGVLPIVIYAIPEGTVLNPGNVLVQVRATDKKFAWLASFVETMLVRAIWYPSTVATVSRECKKIIKSYLEDTTEDEIIPEVLPFRLHDFGGRGTSSAESAGLGGMAHLINFMGTDTVEALYDAEDYYDAEGPVGFSIPASEHSTMTSWGRENEYDAFENMIDKYGGPGKLFACVSDSYDIWKAIKDGWGGRLKEKVLSNGGTLVVRPDSGDPVKNPVKAIELLYKVFGGTVNKKGYKVLNPAVRLLQGDGINTKSIGQILELLKRKGFSAENIAFGMGGALLQKIDRDTLKFAMKTNAVQINGEWKDVYKQPVDEPFKKSKAGKLALVDTIDGPTTIREDELETQDVNMLEKVWENGTTHRTTTFEEIRKNATL